MKDVDAIVILQPGSLSTGYGERPDGKVARVKRQLGVCGESSMRLIESRGRRVLVDTGFRNEMDVGETNLKLKKQYVEALLSVHGCKSFKRAKASGLHQRDG